MSRITQNARLHLVLIKLSYLRFHGCDPDPRQSKAAEIPNEEMRYVRLSLLS